MSNKPIYTRRRATRQEWKSLAAELIQLAACIVSLLALNWALNTLAHYVV